MTARWGNDLFGSILHENKKTLSSGGNERTNGKVEKGANRKSVGKIEKIVHWIQRAGEICLLESIQMSE